MYLNMFAALIVMAVLSSLLYAPAGESKSAQEGEQAAAAEAGITLPEPGSQQLLQDYTGNVAVTEEGSPMLRAVQKSLQHADAVMLKQNEIHRELIEEATK